jgi:hypothetical protein
MTSLELRLAQNLGYVPVGKVAFTMPTPEQIEMIKALIASVMTLIKSCKKTPEAAVVLAKNPSDSDKRQVKAVVRKELGFLKNIFQGRKYVDAVLKTGQDTTVDEMREALA